MFEHLRSEVYTHDVMVKLCQQYRDNPCSPPDIEYVKRIVASPLTQHCEPAVVLFGGMDPVLALFVECRCPAIPVLLDEFLDSIGRSKSNWLHECGGSTPVGRLELVGSVPRPPD